jgi:hypothetical protein
MGARPLRLAAVSVFLGVATAVSSTGAQLDPFVAMDALRVPAPAPAPDVTFQALDGRQVLRGRPVLLTFFTTW